MTKIQALHNLQKEQQNNPLRRYKEVRHHYSNFKRTDWVFLNWTKYRSYLPNNYQEKSSYRRPLNAKFPPWLTTNPSLVLPVTLTFMEKLLKNCSITETQIPELFEWGLQYILCKDLQTPIASLQELEAVLKSKDWLKSQSILELQMLLRTVQL